jgi:hypothetical protein
VALGGPEVGRAVAPRIGDEVRRLHEESLRLAEVRGRRARRELRAVREAEKDLLRSLGFVDFDAFSKATAGLESRPLEPTTAGSQRSVEQLREALQHATNEVRDIGDALRRECATLASFSELARVEAERVIDEAHRDARQLREEAAVEAREIVDRARTEAVALTRDALVTIDGLRSVAELEALAKLSTIELDEESI